MIPLRTLLTGLLFPLSACLRAAPAPLEWFSVSTPGQAALFRSDAGLLGQDESPSMLVDLCARGGSYTGVDLTYQNDEASEGRLRWKQPAVDFGLETAVEAIPGLVFGLDANDHHPKTLVSDGTAKWQLFDPQGGLRLGGGVDLLRAWREKSQWRWVVAGWIPVFSQTSQWELRTGVIWARNLRLDFSANWSETAIPARWVVPTDSLAAEDTTWWRADQNRWTVRLGGSPAKNQSLQGWFGRRELKDPGPGGEPSWRTNGQAFFGGVQSSLRTGPAAWELEAHAESGTEDLRFDGSSVFATLPDSGKVQASTHFVNASGRARASLDWTRTTRFTLDLSMAWMDLEDGTQSGTSLPPIAAANGTWASTKRISSLAGASLKLSWLDLEPFGGLQCRIQDGQSVPLWQGLVPRSTGRTWSVPIGLRLARSGSMSGLASYAISGEIPISATPRPSAGLRHHVELKQGF